jgi:toxin ParE1/3/4
MAFKIIWSLQARDDLKAIALFIARDNPAVAETFGFRLMAKVDALANFPEMGRVVPGKHDESIREVILRPYRIIYRVISSQQVIGIARIWHGARGEPDIPSRLVF